MELADLGRAESLQLTAVEPPVSGTVACIAQVPGLSDPDLRHRSSFPADLKKFAGIAGPVGLRMD
jgi:hypothetical protein